MTSLVALLTDPNMQWILLGCILLGLSSGVIGSFMYLRKQSLMGDALAHAALPGVCVAFMITGTKSIFGFMIGAAIAGIVATFAISALTRYSRVKSDSAIAAVLSVFFGFGIMLLTEIQHSGAGNQSGLDKFLFGQAAAMVLSDVYTMAVISVVLIGICILFFKEFKLLSFDPGFARGLGFPAGLLDKLLMLLIVIAVVAGIQAVGVIMMAALLITPAVSARYWTEKLGVMVCLSGLFGAIAGLGGTVISSLGQNLPTGPLCVLCATVVFGVSLIFAPQRGMISKAIVRLNARKSLEQGVGAQPREERAL
ncbi:MULTISPECIES: metal ABC transporter permease [Paenibacillus]|uniref:metal ABC transporter permease n=1 Tax=Paenibacillus TaxID=44249 RepID=UPI00030A7B99|nr:MULTISPECIES: iron chelate uptake ABC transporter family permease subunit [Paenibacillus]KKD55609.1 manganese ABC transporter [Paenibacillus sp. ICGEB2008]UNL95909.1 manganese ABC transporter [Paenibacillus polymyxa]URJ37739.1 iron chelate uptake ABC transporter family permease subunit [Paenibacillus polymyxa]